MLRRTLLALPTSLTLLLGLALPAEAQPRCETPVTVGGAPEQARAGRAGQTERRSPDGMTSREAGERLWRTHHTVGKVRVCNDRGDTCDPAPRAPRAWRPVAPRPLRPSVTVRRDDRWPAPTSIPSAEPVPCEPMTRGPAAWQQPAPARVVPRAWREALPAHRLLDAHRRVREAADANARCAVIDEVARTWAVTVDQVICLAAALPPAERLAALTRLHAATSDASAYARTYGLLGEEERLVLHVRITRPFDAETAARRARLERLRHEERQLQRVLGDD